MRDTVLSTGGARKDQTSILTDMIVADRSSHERATGMYLIGNSGSLGSTIH